MLPTEQSYLETVRRTQWLAPQKLLNYQGRLLEEIARHAHTSVPFYRQRLAPLFRTGGCDPSRWREVPILTRAEVEAHGDALRALSVPRHMARESEGKTAGTTGPPLQFVMSEMAVLTSLCHYERILEAHDIDRTAHHARIRLEPPGTADYPEGREDTGWNLSCRTARYSKLGVHTSIAEQADWLARRMPTYLTTYQSVAAALAQHMEASGASLHLKGVLTVGETVDPAVREDVKRVFDCNIVDRYGATEIGLIAFECPAGGGYHVCAESVLLELLDDDGNDAAEGTPGRVVLTSLYNFAMPFIRYDIGDLAVAAHGPCPCGRTLPRLVTILGRQRGVFTFPDGAQYSPWRWKRLFYRPLNARQVQFLQTAPDRIDVRYVPNNGAGPPDPAMIEHIGRTGIHPMVVCRAVPVAEFPRSPSGKIEDSISLVTRPARRGGA
jgi:phenylacetate-CoA ligase